MATTKLIGVVIVFIPIGILPYAGPPKTRLEALDTDDGKKKPEEANEKCDIDQQRRSLLQTPKNDLGERQYVAMRRRIWTYGGTTGEIQETDDSQTAQHLENENDAAILRISHAQKKSDPV